MIKDEYIEDCVCDCCEAKRVSRSAKTLGSIKSEKKAKSSRENGKKGGRPKKTPTKEVTEEAHYEKRAGMPLWITYIDGQEVVEPYNHQDEMYSNMCASPNYCRCTD